MPRDDVPPSCAQPAALVAGYLNFSSGSFDPAAWRAAGELYAALEPPGSDGRAAEGSTTAASVWRVLRLRLAELEATQPAFRDSSQARRMLDVVFDRLLPAYRRFHADLLEHQPPGGIERPFFVMAAAAAALAEAAGEDAAGGDDELVRRALERLNDYVGWRPVAVLENGQLSSPYPHELVRPIPLFVAGAGVSPGRYAAVVTGALAILAEAPADLLRQADFDLDALEELALDPRAFDFLHPAASRPNYLFGLWDPARIDEQGRYRRMVVQQATLDGILSWPAAANAGTAAELQGEASAVLAGVMLMASGLSGHGPGARQAGLALSDLLPRIAGYRDDFYRWLLARLPDGHRQRLEEEARVLRQPFGGVRRHINATLAGRRGRQVENVSLASVMARLGRAEAAERLAGAVPAASARIFARMTGRIVAARRALWQRGDVRTALGELDAAVDLLFRAVGCGAAVDPWNILGLAGQFPLHEPGGESLPDPRIDDLVEATRGILDGYAAAWRHAGLAGERTQAAAAAAALEKLAAWWDRHATTTVSGVPHLSGRECFESGREVLVALERRRATSAQPPPGFWRQAVAAFESPRSHAQAVDALLAERDVEGAAGLLVHWASLLEGPAVERTGPAWITAASAWLSLGVADGSDAGRTRVRRFLEMVEANSGGVVDAIDAVAIGQERTGARPPVGDADAEDADQADGEERVAAAYESMVWRDSTDDGVDGGMLDAAGPPGDSAAGLVALDSAAEFLGGVLRLFRGAVTAWCLADTAAGTAPSRDELDAVVGWRHWLRRLRRTLVRAATAVAGRDPAPPPGMPATEFDRLRWHRDVAAERLIETAVQVEETLWTLAARRHVGAAAPESAAESGASGIGRLLAALVGGDAETARRGLERVRLKLAGKAVLYVPLSRNGQPERIVRARVRERLLERLATALPRAGLVDETVQLVLLAKGLESRRPPGAASVSEFDRVFEAATTSLVERIVETAEADAAAGDPTPAAERILEGLALLVPRLLETWMTHARQLRLSVLERVRDDRAFAGLREFVERYGTGLFTQHLMTPASLRGVLRGGVRNWLERLLENDGEAAVIDGSTLRPARLREAVESGALPIRQAAARLRLVLESVAENHAEYRDWNSTTTQSDRGEFLHILLDQLRVKAEYDRIAWTLRPVNMAHRVLARRGATEAAASWRGRMRDETRDTAAGLVKRLDEIEARWGVRLASISDRVRRPFTAVLEQDELAALVPAAVAELFQGEPAGAAGRLEAKAESFLGVASGSGVEVPEWLERLSAAVDAEIERVRGLPVAGGGATPPAPLAGLAESVPWRRLSWEVLRQALGG